MRLCLIGLLGILGFSCSNNFLESEFEKKKKEDVAKIERYARSNNLTLEIDDSGIYYQKLNNVPEGRSPQIGEVAHISYKMEVLEGATILSAVKEDSIVFNQFSSNIIDGFILAYSLLKEGERGIFLIPSGLAWANISPSQEVPAWSVIRLELEIHKLYNEEEQIQSYLNRKNFPKIETLEDGLIIVRSDSVTKGAKVATKNAYRIQYAGKFLNDQQFDSGTLTVTVGDGMVIPGFEKGIAAMSIGESATIIMSSALGYGIEGSGRIPPFTPLVFEIKVLEKL